MSKKFNSNINSSKKLTTKKCYENTFASNSDTNSSPETRNNSIINSINDRKKENKLALQFLIINSVEIIYIISLSMLIITVVKHVYLAHYSRQFYAN